MRSLTQQSQHTYNTRAFHATQEVPDLADPCHSRGPKSALTPQGHRAPQAAPFSDAQIYDTPRANTRRCLHTCAARLHTIARASSSRPVPPRPTEHGMPGSPVPSHWVAPRRMPQPRTALQRRTREPPQHMRTARCEQAACPANSPDEHEPKTHFTTSRPERFGAQAGITLSAPQAFRGEGSLMRY